MGNLQHSLNLLNYWHKVESFTPNEIDKDDKGRPITGDETLPWAPGVVRLNLNEAVSFHKLFFGVFYVSEANQAINQYFKKSGQDSPNLQGVLSSFCECIFNSDGKYKPGSLKFSTMPWAMGKLLTNDLFTTRWSDEFAEFTQQATTEIERIFQEKCNYIQLERALQVLVQVSKWLPSSMSNNNWTEEENRGCFPLLRVTFTKKIEEGNSAQEVSSIVPDDEELPVVEGDEADSPNDLKTGAEGKPRDQDEPVDIMNSFYLRDLEKVTGAVKEGRIGKALKEYLSYDKERNRLDVGQNPSLLHAFNSIDRMNIGRWPMDKAKSLNLMQQTSVNLIIERLLDSEGLFSVNGPPGTGKTTLLRDIIAAIVTNRADKLISFEQPANAFEKAQKAENKQRMMGDQKYYTYYVYSLDESLGRDGIVVASSNNGAVQNVTGELPGVDAIKGYDQDANASYFKGTAQFVMDDPEVWGMISAILGKGANRAKFVDRYWSGVGEVRNPEVVPAGMEKLLKDSTPSVGKPWSTAVADYRGTRERLNDLISNMKKWHQQLKEYHRLQMKLRAIPAEIAKLEWELNQLQQEAVNLNTEGELLKQNIDNYREALQLEQQRFSPWLSLMCWSKKVKQYKASLARYKNLLQGCLLQKAEHDRSANRNQKSINNVQQFLVEQRNLERVTRTSIDQYDQLLKEIPEGFRKSIPTDAYWNLEGVGWDDFQKGSPWVYEELANARTQLFLQALAVHHSFIENARKQIRNNLKFLMHYLKGQVPFSLVKPHLPNLWNTLFLAVPVVSTTFASLATMMKGLEQEAIGWLIVDEAGQALPQAAVGGLWRAKRAIIVGDPLQIEPVLTIPDSMLVHFKDHYKIPDRIATQTCSVQFVADLANPIGTEIETKEGLTWIGCPLYVHRRCLEPMFSIANEIAYSDKMVYATGRPNHSAFPLGDSRWIDVRGKTNSKHWIPEQGQEIRKLVKTAFEHMKQSRQVPSLYIISPFTEVVKEMQNELRRNPKELCGIVNINEYYKWISTAVGTVHTFQGKQSETVIFCLGLDKSAEGAAKWASEKPNILNVAATRAMYRFLIVGDRSMWNNRAFFNVASKKLN